MSEHPWRAARSARAAPDVPPADTDTEAGGAFDPADHTVAEVLAYVADHPEERDAIWASETAGKNRSTLLDAL